MSNSGSSPEKQGLTSLLVKGVVSAVALAGTTAIPIVVQRSLQAPSAPTASPTATAPASPTQVSPLPAVNQMGVTGAAPQEIDQDEKGEKPRGKGKKKRQDE
ncbi:MAG: hypothetical protein HY785_27915 [Oscillatoriophycideae cyanobacterium NC_groundwater_1537_Pr4_S-0.65um_50_18]|nr:hypothetical protein [Oscillatoriophycideae cyanobacterium NC_groundwater_1537_Pr4_S-0.65um_50_18]